MPWYRPGEFIKMKWWVGQICDVSTSGYAFELESIYYLASKSISRQWIVAKNVDRVTTMPLDQAVQYSETHDFVHVTDLLEDIDALETQWRQAPQVSLPFPAPGQFIRVCGWCVRIRDVGDAHDRNFLVIESPKLLSRACGDYEVLEVKPKDSYRQIQVISQEDALTDIPRFRHDVQMRIHRAQEILTRWKHGN